MRIARTPWIMLPAQNSGQNLKNTATTKNPVQNEYQKNERKRAMEEKQNQNQQVQQVQVYQNPTPRRIEIHSKHQKLVVRDMKTGRYINKR